VLLLKCIAALLPMLNLLLLLLPLPPPLPPLPLLCRVHPRNQPRTMLMDAAERESI